MATFVLSSTLLFGCEDFTISQNPSDYIDPDQNQAQLTFLSPQNGATDVAGTTPVTFLWNKPIFTLQNPEVTQRFLESAVTISPAIEGSWQVLGTTGILFEPKENWKNSTRYEFSVPLNMDPYAFETSRVKLERVEADELIGKKPLTAFFNQEISLAEAQKCGLKIGEDVIAYEVAYRTYTEWDKEGTEIEKTDTTSIEFTPLENWKDDADGAFVIPTEFLGTDGPLPTKEEQIQTFHTIAPFAITNFSLPNEVFANINVNFSTNVSKEKFYDHLTISPVEQDVFMNYILKKKADLLEGEKSGYFWLEPFGEYWQPNQEYTVTISGDLTDQYGRKLGEDQTHTFTARFPNRVQSVFFPQDLRAYRRGEFPQFSLWYSGTIREPWLKIEALWPEKKEFAKPLEWAASSDKKTVVEFNMPKEFPEFFDGEAPAGLYRVTLSYLSPWNQNYRDKQVAEFTMVDFPVEMKEDAKGTITLFPTAFPGEDISLAEVPNVTVLTSQWNEGGQNYSVQTDIGVRDLSFQKPENFAFVMVESDGQVGIASDRFQNGISPWDSPVAFDPWSYQNPLTATAFPDRPLFRPGDEMFFKSIFRERKFFEKAFPLQNVDPEKKQDYKIVIMDPKYQEVYQEKFTTQGGALDGSWHIPEEATLGQYQARIEFGNGERFGASAFFDFYVTEYRKPDFLIDSQFDVETAIWQDKITAEIGAEYAFGGALSGREVEYRLSLFGHKNTYWYWERENMQDKLITEGKATFG
ncbi:hypothetical protein HC823_00145 [Candidatus Gracilibacteria bacterium]|nr:hypothetical protein [Candidatus Gracilibacteria bacterium]